MGKTRKRVNPFYVLLLVAGIAFCITACAYGVMSVKQLHAPHTPTDQMIADAGFVQFMDQRGATIMVIELAVLALATLGAIATDSYWTRET